MLKPNRLADKDKLESYNDFSRRQKTVVILLAIFSLIVVVAWVLQINYQIRKPFQSPESSRSSVEELNQALIDSDGDGLSDYDELYIYKTSPYLEDTDSDGISDYDEVQRGTNPSCPEGQNCYTSELLINENNNISESSLLNTNQSSDLTVAENEGGASSLINPEEVTPAMLRQVLLQNGYDAEILNQISDEDLLASYQEALKVQGEEISE